MSEDANVTEHPLLARLRERFPDALQAAGVYRGDLGVTIAPQHVVAICRFLRDDPETAFDLLVDVTVVDYLGSEPRFEVVYHLASVARQHRLRVKARVPEETPRIASVTQVWRGADWLEREAYDMYGIVFDGHPDLRRIYLYDEFEGHPLRKDYPKEKRQPLVRREDLDRPQAERREEREDARYGRWQ